MRVSTGEQAERCPAEMSTGDAKKFRAAALRAALRGRPGPRHRAQDEAALALVPHLRRWVPLAGLEEASIRAAASRALRALAGAAIWVVIDKTWVDGWPTPCAAGRGVAPARCAAANLVSFRRLTEAVSEASALQPPASVAAAIGLRTSPRVRSSAAAGFAAPDSDHLFLTLRLDTYQKAAGPRRCATPPCMRAGGTAAGDFMQTSSSLFLCLPCSRIGGCRCLAVHLFAF